MSRKIIGVTVGTPMRPQALIEKTEQASQIAKNTEDISDLREKIPEVYVKTVNGKKGDVTLDADDVGTYSYSQIDVIKKDIYEHIQSEAYHLETYADNGDAALSKALDESVQYLLEKIDEIPTSCGGTGGAVSSVNGKTGAVELTAEDVGARPSTWTPTAEDVGARSDTWMPTAEEVGATTKSYVDGEIGERFITVTSVNEIIGSVSNQKTITCFLDNDCLEELGLSDTEAMYGFGLAVRKSPGFILLQFAINGTRFVYGELSTGTKTFEFEEGYSKAELDAKFTALNNKYQPKGNYLTDAPVKSVNGKTGDVTLSASDVGAATSEEVSSLKSDLTKKADSTALERVASEVETLKENEVTAEDIANLGFWKETDGKTYVDSEITNLEIKLGQQHLTFAEGETVEEALTWLKANGDTSKMYVLPDGFFYEYKETIVETGGVAYTNVLPLAKNTDRTTIYNGKGYSEGGKRLSSSGSESTASVTSCVITGFIDNVKVGDTIRIKNFYAPEGVNTYVISYKSDNTKVSYKTFTGRSSQESWNSNGGGTWLTVADGITTITLTEALFGTGFDAIRISGVITADTIITINEEIKEGGGTAIVSTWASTGQALVPTNYDSQIANLTDITDAQTKAIVALQEAVKNGTSSADTEALTLIRSWDKPIYERLTPFLLDEDLNITKYPQSYTDSQDADRTLRKANVQAVYDEYNALCTAHPDFVRDITNVEHGLDGATETTFGGLCSDGEQYVRVYEFCEREGRHSNTTDDDLWSETKPTFIIVTGIHWEYNGVYSMLNALKLITENPELRDMRRNCRFIVLPMSNPYCFTTYNNSGGGHYNANGVEIHNNFYVDFNNAIDSTHGTAPLSEVETRYIDNAMRKYADTGVCLLTCHSNATKGSNFIWGSVATKFMCNVSMRLVDLMSYAWDSKYDNYRTAIDEQKVGHSNPQEDGDYRCGFASLSTSTGTETKQALWYGMQGINVEVYEKFYLFDPEGTDVSLAVSRGAEVYVNLLRLLAVTYDHNDRDKYAPIPACEME